MKRDTKTMLAAMLLLLGATDAAATDWYVQGGGANVGFSPQFLTIRAGDRVTFLNIGGNHNVVADDGSFRCAHGCDDDGGSGNASSTLWYFTRTFPQPGTIGYFCEPHGSPGSGMYGTIEVLAPESPAVHSVPAVGRAFLMLLAGALMMSAALRWRRRAAPRFPD